MTASGGLQSDATLAVYEEDVVTYADDTTADEWGDGTNFSALAVGLVNRVPDSDEEDYSSDEEPDVPVPDGHAEVCWLGSYERIEMEPTAELRVVDRAFLHGDLVSRASDALGAQGAVVAVHLDLDLRFSDNTLVRGVNAREVQHVRRFRPGHYVVYGDWVGKIHDVREDVVVKFPDGSESLVHDADEDELRPAQAASIFSDEEHCAFFPGCVVHADARFWKNAAKCRWEPGSDFGAKKKPRHFSNGGVVAEVITREVVVIWLAAARKGSGSLGDTNNPLGDRGDDTNRPPVIPSGSGDRNVPPRAMPARALHPLENFAHTCFQLGDKVVVPEEDIVVDLPEDVVVDEENEGKNVPDSFGGSSGEKTPKPDDIRESARTLREIGEDTSGRWSHSERIAALASSEKLLASADSLEAAAAEQVRRVAGRTGGGTRGTDRVGHSGHGAFRTSHEVVDFPDVTDLQNESYDTHVLSHRTVIDNHRRARESALVAAHVCESVGAVGAVNKNNLWYGVPGVTSAGTTRTGTMTETGTRLGTETTREAFIRPCATIVGTHTFVDVRWQDGSTTRRVPAKNLVPLLHLGEHDFWPDQFVTKVSDTGAGGDGDTTVVGVEQSVDAVAVSDVRPIQSSSDIAGALGAGAPPAVATIDAAAADAADTFASLPLPPQTLPSRRTSPVGVVQRVDSGDRVAVVRWLPPDDAFVENDDDAVANTQTKPNTKRWSVADDAWVDFGESAASRPDDTEQVSVYEIREDDKYGFRLGDVVVSTKSFDKEYCARAKNGTLFHTTPGGVVVNPMLAHTEIDLYPLDDDEEDEDDDGDANGESGESSSVDESEYEEAGDDEDDDDEHDEHEYETDSNPASASTDSKQEKQEDATTKRLLDFPLVPPDPKSLGWVGEVVGVRCGFVTVAWGNGKTDFCHPKFLWVVSHEDDSELGSLLGGSDFDDDDGSEASWETLGDGGVDEDERDAVAPAQHRRGVPEATPGNGSSTNQRNAFHADPIARALVTQQREEAEFGWLSRHSDRNAAVGDTGASVDEDSAASESNGTPAEGATATVATVGVSQVTNLTPSEASRAAEALAAAFRGLQTMRPVASVPSERVAFVSETEDAGGATSHEATLDDATIDDATVDGSIPAFASVSDEDDVPMVTAVVDLPGADVHASTGVPGGSGSTAAATRATRSVHASVSDHRFATCDSSQTSNNAAWQKQIQKEWRTLQSSLPPDIFVRVFESRMDLMRCLIIGPSGTPYHDGAFVFDFCLPAEYPAVPPTASFHSFGYRVNPNLYENGKVCLSLLATWQGKGSEVWDPVVSNMLQVLVSIQGLVLVDDPYYNEAGYEKQVGSEEGAKLGGQYNEQAFLGTCKTVLAVLRNPPRHFEGLITQHFLERGSGFLSACDAYLDGCPIGEYVEGWKEALQADNEASPKDTESSATKSETPETETSSATPPSSKRKRVKPPPSAGFKLALRKLLPKLVMAFETNRGDKK